MNRSMPPTAAQVRLFQEVGQRLDRKGMIAANDGNLSWRDADGTILITATGARKGYLGTDEVVRIDLNGELLFGKRPPSSELAMHLAILRVRPDVRAIVHAHPAIATGFAVARRPMDQCVLPEIILTLGSVPIAPYGTPGTDELPRGIEPVAREHDVFLLANHGAVALGPDLEEAYFRMERVEHTARILLVSQMLGRTHQLSGEQVSRLLATGPDPQPDALPCRVDSAVPGADSEAARIASMVTEVLRARGF